MESAVGLWSLVVEGEPDDQVDVSRTYMWPGAIGKPTHEVAGREASCEVDALVPGTDIAEERQPILSRSGPLRSCRRRCDGPASEAYDLAS